MLTFDLEKVERANAEAAAIIATKETGLLTEAEAAKVKNAISAKIKEYLKDTL